MILILKNENLLSMHANQCTLQWVCAEDQIPKLFLDSSAPYLLAQVMHFTSDPKKTKKQNPNALHVQNQKQRQGKFPLKKKSQSLKKLKLKSLQPQQFQ